MEAAERDQEELEELLQDRRGVREPPSTAQAETPA
jgi:hypothetical protein